MLLFFTIDDGWKKKKRKEKKTWCSTHAEMLSCAHPLSSVRQAKRFNVLVAAGWEKRKLVVFVPLLREIILFVFRQAPEQIKWEQDWKSLSQSLEIAWVFFLPLCWRFFAKIQDTTRYCRPSPVEGSRTELQACFVSQAERCLATKKRTEKIIEIHEKKDRNCWQGHVSSFIGSSGLQYTCSMSKNSKHGNGSATLTGKLRYRARILGKTKTSENSQGTLFEIFAKNETILSASSAIKRS